MKQDRTIELREAVKACQVTTPKPRQLAQHDKDSFMQSATSILAAINRLDTFLSKMRKVYLSTSTNTLRPVQQPTTAQVGSLEFWESVTSLTDRQRDEIDFFVKVQLKRLLDQIKSLEHAEKARQEAVAHTHHTAMSRFLSSVNVAANQVEDTRKAHRAAITLYLNQALTKCSKEQTFQQETRLKRQRDKSSSLSGNLDSYGTKLAQSNKAKFNKADIASHELLKPSPSMTMDDTDIESILTPQQVQQFESEQSALVQELNTSLAQIKKAESSLLEISALQSELVVHLTQQSELTDKLYEDSLFVSGKVGDANQQLKKARERNKESRVYLLAFLIGASLTLLFLDYY